MAEHGLHLVTGGGGFIGSHLAAALVDAGRPVRVADLFSTGRRENLAALAGKIELLEADVRDPAAAAAACRGVEVVFHVAALPSVPLSIERPLDSLQHSMVAVASMLEAARAAGVRRFVYSSSSSVYGGEGDVQREADPPRPRSPYAAGKLCGEVLVRAFADSYGLDGVSLRYFNVYGPRQPARSAYSAVIPAFITRMFAGQAPIVHGDGRQSRDFTFVGDVVRANLAAANCPRPLTGAVVNIGTGRSTSLLELVALLNRVLGTNVAPTFEPSRPGDVRRSLADVAAAEALLGFRAETTIEEGLGRTAAWFRSATAAAQQ